MAACTDRKDFPVQNLQTPEESNNIRNYLVRVAKEITERSVTDITSMEVLEKSRDERTAKLADMLGLVDVPLNEQRPPLNVRITGTIRKDGYRIEKLYYESSPGLYVPANLYIPDNITGPSPAILYLCGHARDQKVHYQTHPAKFARLGFVCLIVETIQYGEVWGEHWGSYARGWFNWFSRGYNPGGVETWNAIRGLDLLAERAEVDKEKLGVTGISGGGAISWFTAAMDGRVKAVAPVCGASTIEAHICTRTIDGHCDCMWINNLYGWDMPELGAMIAPRPLLIGQADRDGLNQLESAREIYSRLAKVYALFGKEDDIGFVESPGGHSYHRISRERIFSFFMKYLMNKELSPEEAGDIDETPASLLSEDDLRTYINTAPKDDITKFIQDAFVVLPEPPELKGEDQLAEYRTSVINRLKEQAFHTFPRDPVPFDSIHVFRTLDYAKYGKDIFNFVSERGWRLKLEIYWRNPKSEKHPLMIVLRNPGDLKGAAEEFIVDLDTTWNFACLETRGVGESGWPSELQWHVRRASAWTGRTIASMRVYDVLRGLEFSRQLEGVDPDMTGIAARNEMAGVALYAGLLDGRCKTIIIQDPPPTQNVAGNPDGRGEALEILNCLRITDVNQLPALLNPAEVIVLGEMPETYAWSEKVISTLDKKSIRTISNISEFRSE
jgi:hypothetical protein